MKGGRHTVAAADIGSNAIRLVIARPGYRSDGNIRIEKEQSLRLPVRVGADVFSKGRIGNTTRNRLLAAMRIFSNLCAIYKPVASRVCATSAMREASNSNAIASAIYRHCGLEIDVIGSRSEARLIYRALGNARNRPGTPRTLHIDVGGGSTEIIYGAREEILEIHSFATGTVRRQHKSCLRAENSMLKWLDETIENYPRYAITASGGNARHLYKICGHNSYIEHGRLRNLQARLQAMSVAERIERMKMSEDRADTIVHAADIYLSILRHSRHRKLYIPSANLVEGIIHNLFSKLTTER